jgi:dTDP-4-dehydrorhamnose 3,5-epimerase
MKIKGKSVKVFKKGEIKGVIIKELKKYTDNRGWLIELLRQDEIDQEIFPVMSYVSETKPGVGRGPHEHVDQTDFFAFIGPSNFKLYLWDDREKSETKGNMITIVLGKDNPGSAVIPPGVVHAYKNIGTVPGLVFNAPNRLFAGKGKKEEVDEIRHEDVTESPYQLTDE